MREVAPFDFQFPTAPKWSVIVQKLKLKASRRRHGRAGTTAMKCKLRVRARFPLHYFLFPTFVKIEVQHTRELSIISSVHSFIEAT